MMRDGKSFDFPVFPRYDLRRFNLRFPARSTQMTEEQLKTLRPIKKFGVVLVILGLICGAFGIYFLILGSQTLSWPSVTGKLVNVMVKSKIDSDPGSGGAARQLDTEYYFSLNYRYHVDGSTYSSSFYSFGNGHVASDKYYNTREEAEAQARKEYKGVKELPVYYDPEDPNKAVLKPGWNLGTIAPSLMSLFLLASGWLVCFIVNRAKAKGMTTASAP